MMKYEPVLFHAELNHQPVYHTNVVMSIGNTVAVCCLDAIGIDDERNTLTQRLTEHHSLLTITLEQMQRFAGNMLLVRNKTNETFWVLSQAALESLDENQIVTLEKDGRLLPLTLDTIETFGGGSARCMLAETGW